MEAGGRVAGVGGSTSGKSGSSANTSGGGGTVAASRAPLLSNRSIDSAGGGSGGSSSNTTPAGVGSRSVSGCLNSLDSGSKIAGLYDLETTLGRGHFAIVKLARHVFTGEKVAVKVIDKSKLDDVSRAHLFQEVRCMKLVQHPNVVRLYEVIDTQTKLYLVLELADGGDLYDYIMKQDRGLGEPLARHYFAQIVRAISYCHRLHVVHRDLKPENVVFFERAQVVKLTDFGFSNKFCPGQKLETSCGSLAYSAPEILLGDSYDAPAVDVWSLGVILYMLVCGQAPFQEANDSETLTMIMDCKYTIPSHISQPCAQLIGSMLVREPEKRATLQEIAKHQWLSGENLESSELPLVSCQRLSDQDRTTIIQKMINGNICTKEQITEALEKNEYNYITATYFLLAERMLRALEPKTTPRLNRMAAPTVQVDSCKEDNDDCSGSLSPTKQNQNLLSMGTGCVLRSNLPPSAADIMSQRSRKCSIVAEDDEEESCSSSSSLNRRGSRSEGKLHLAVQEIHRQARLQINSITEACTAPSPLKVSGVNSLVSNSGSSVSSNTAPPGGLSFATATVTAVRGSNAGKLPPSTCGAASASRFDRRSKLKKGSAASCSSSEASDDDFENKRKGTLGSSGSYEDGSRNSPDRNVPYGVPMTATAVPGGRPPPPPSHNPPVGSSDARTDSSVNSTSLASGGRCVSTSGTSGGGGRRRRGGETTRLRESQSLNRITEVTQENESNFTGNRSGNKPASGAGNSETSPPHVQKPAAGDRCSSKENDGQHHISSGKATVNAYHSSRDSPDGSGTNGFRGMSNTIVYPSEDSSTQSNTVFASTAVQNQGNNVKRSTLLGKYLSLQKKLCLPLIGRGSSSRHYKVAKDINENVGNSGGSGSTVSDNGHHHRSGHRSNAAYSGSSSSASGGGNVRMLRCSSTASGSVVASSPIGTDNKSSHPSAVQSPMQLAQAKNNVDSGLSGRSGGAK